jgi:hypothetical protein
MNSSVKRTVRYFISYTRDDGHLPRKLLERLSHHLKDSREYEFLPWRDSEILPGEAWHVEIQRALGEADFGLLLVSPAFLRNPYIIGHELGAFVRQGKPCIPVTLCEIDFERHDLRGLDPLHFFGFTPPRDVRPRSFERCTSGLHQADFALELFRAIVDHVGKHVKVSVTPEAVGLNSSLAALCTIHRTFACQFREFRGRGEELGRLERMLLQDAKCAGVVIGALGGMGKTALANQFCTTRSVEKRFDFVVGASAKKQYLDVDAFGLSGGGLTTSDHAVETLRGFLLEVGSQLKLKDPGALADDKLEQGIRAATHGKRVLFLLDNLETIDETAAALNLLGRLCSPPEQKFLITARKLPQSGGPAVRMLPLICLGKSDSAALVRDLLEELDAELAASLADESDAIAGILSRAAGHPLALRLLTGKLVAQGEKAILRLPDPAAAGDEERWSGELFRFVFDEAFLSYLGSLAVEVGCVIASYAHGVTERDLLSACQQADPDMTPAALRVAMERLLRTFCVQREHTEGEAVLGMHPLTREFFRSVATNQVAVGAP